jgi:hypothetical protein
MSGRQRRELAHQRMLEACERQRLACASPGYYDDLLGQSGTPDPVTAPDQPEDEQEGKTEAPRPAAPVYSAEAAQGYLLSRELFLTPVAIDHILERHGERHRDPSASEFRAPYRTLDGIQSLIAEGLGQVEDIEKNLRMDRRGRSQRFRGLRSRSDPPELSHHESHLITTAVLRPTFRGGRSGMLGS